MRFPDRPILEYPRYRLHLKAKRLGVTALRGVLRAGIHSRPASLPAMVTGTVVMLDCCLGLGDALMISPILSLLARLGPVTVVSALPPFLDWPGEWLQRRTWNEMIAAAATLTAKGQMLLMPRLGAGGLLRVLTWPGGVPAGILALDGRAWIDTTDGSVGTDTEAGDHYTDGAVACARALLRRAGQDGKPAAIVRLPPRLAAAEDLARTLVNLGVPEDRPLVALAPWATSRIRRWPLERWSRLSARLAQARPELAFVLLGSADERRFGAEIAGGAVETAEIHNLMGQVSLAETAAVIDRAAALVACDNGLMHLGLGVATPVVAVFGSTNPAARLYGARWRLAYEPGLCPKLRSPCYPDLHRDPACPGAIECLVNLAPERVADLTLEALTLKAPDPELVGID